MPNRNALAFSLLLLVASCDPTWVPSQFEPSSWGGEHALLTIDYDSAHLEYDCATGNMELPVVIGQDGRFSATGRHVLEHGGPIRIGEQVTPRPARYEGSVAGGRMKFTVTLLDSATVIGPFEVQRGRTARVFKCL